MSGSPGFGPYSFAVSDDEARIAAARAGLRRNLAGRLERYFVAPLIAFALALAFIAILAFTGLIGRRAAEASLILAALAFMATRFVGHWRLRGAQTSSLAAVRTLQQGGETQVRLDAEGATMEGAAGVLRRCQFRAGAQAEDAGGMIYLWPAEGEPVFIPARAFADSEEAGRLLAFVRARAADRS